MATQTNKKAERTPNPWTDVTYVWTKAELLDHIQRLVPEDAIILKPALGGGEVRAADRHNEKKAKKYRRYAPSIHIEHFFAPDVMRDPYNAPSIRMAMQQFPLYWFTPEAAQHELNMERVREVQERVRLSGGV